MSNDSTVAELRARTTQVKVRDDQDTAFASPGTTSARDTGPAAGGGRPTRHATYGNRKPRSTATVLLSLAGVLVAILYCGSLVVLSVAGASPDEPASWNGPTVPSAMIAMYSVVAAFVLAFSIIVRHADRN